MTARARPDRDWAECLLFDRRSTPFVSLFAAQLLAQLGQLQCQFGSKDKANKTY